VICCLLQRITLTPVTLCCNFLLQTMPLYFLMVIVEKETNGSTLRPCPNFFLNTKKGIAPKFTIFKSNHLFHLPHRVHLMEA
jgi:hypothetical protein